MKVCYLLPTLANTFLNELSKSVKAKAAADGVEVFVYGAEEGGATAQYSQIENCVSQGVNAMIVMAPGSIENVIPAVQEAQKKGIKVIGVPPGELEPFDAIMHTDQYEDGTKVVKMACDFINKTYPDAPAKGVEVVVMGSESGEKQMNLRYQGYRTIAENCAKANVVQYVDTPRVLTAYRRSHLLLRMPWPPIRTSRSSLCSPALMPRVLPRPSKPCRMWTSRSMVFLPAIWIRP